MTSLKQIEANRRNSQNSTGPRTAEGKERARGNAVRHGLTAETVIGVLENPEDYKAFELAVASDFDVQTAVERELVLRLACLLWRLRRALAIETGLLQIQEDHSHNPAGHCRAVPLFNADDGLGNAQRRSNETNIDLARRFLQAANADCGTLDRLSRYETTLWRQAWQVLFILEALRRRDSQSWQSSPRRNKTFGRWYALSGLKLLSD